MECFHKAPDQNNPLVQYCVGMSSHLAENYAKARKWYEKASNQGFAEAQNNIGSLYEGGQGVPEDLAEAKHWYRLAKSNGSKKAKKNLKKLENQ